MGKPEIYTKERDRGKTIPQPSFMGIPLDRPDIAELALRRITSGWNGPNANTSGAVSIPRREYSEAMQGLATELESHGRVRVVERIPKHCQSPAEAGNVIVYFSADESVARARQEIDPSLLGPLVKKFNEHPDLITGATIFPTASPQKLNGVSIELDQRKPKWWRVPAELGWSFGRGIGIWQLGMDFDAFVSGHVGILEETHRLGRKLQPGLLKYVEFLADPSGQTMFVSLAGGRGDLDAHALAQMLSKTTSSKEAQKMMNDATVQSVQLRRDLIAAISEELGIPVQTEVTNTPYILFSPERAMVFSGGVGDSDIPEVHTAQNGMLPFTLGFEEVLLTDPPDTMRSLGLRQTVTPRDIITPGGVLIHDGKGQSVKLPTQEVIMQTLQPNLHLKIVALGHHENWRPIISRR